MAYQFPAHPDVFVVVVRCCIRQFFVPLAHGVAAGNPGDLVSVSGTRQPHVTQETADQFNVVYSCADGRSCAPRTTVCMPARMLSLYHGR